MSFENPQPIPEDNELPLRVSKSKPMSHQGRESTTWEIAAIDRKDEERLLALKQVKREDFATEDEMRKSREFYEFLKRSSIGGFVPDTLYFKARETKEASPHAYRLQKMIEGKRVDELANGELYKDPEVRKQLLIFVEGAIETFEKAKESGEHTPDLYGNKLLSIFLFNPRHSSNIMIAEKPDNAGRRVFFVDVAPQVQQLEGVGRQYQKYIGSKLQLLQLRRWKRILEADSEAK